MEEFHHGLLNAHNEYRNKHNVSELVWSDELACEAQKWADQIAVEDKFRHVPASERSGQGESIASNQEETFSGTKATDMWYSEIKEYDFTKPRDYNPAAGHFTQVIWKSTQKVGAGMATSKSGKHFVVARYLPAGNKKGTFDKNVFPVGGDQTDACFGKSKTLDDKEEKEQERKKLELRKKIKQPPVKAILHLETGDSSIEYSYKEYETNTSEDALSIKKTAEVMKMHIPKRGVPAYLLRKNDYLMPGKTYSVTHYLYL